METTFFLKSLSLFHCVPLYVCRLCINFQDLCARLLGMAALRILLLTFISRIVIDFLSIRKVIIFSAIATDDRHPLWWVCIFFGPDRTNGPGYTDYIHSQYYAH